MLTKIVPKTLFSPKLSRNRCINSKLSQNFYINQDSPETFILMETVRKHKTQKTIANLLYYRKLFRQPCIYQNNLETFILTETVSKPLY